MSISNRICKAESIIEKRKGLGFDCVIVRPGETEEQAIEREGHADARFRLVINTDPQPKTEAELDAEIAEVIKDLKKKGLSDDEIRKITDA